MDVASHGGLPLLNRELYVGGLLYGANAGGHSNGVGFGCGNQVKTAAAAGKGGDSGERSEQQQAQGRPAPPLFARHKEQGEQGKSG